MLGGWLQWWVSRRAHLHGLDAILILICKFLCGIADEPGDILSPTLRRCRRQRHLCDVVYLPECRGNLETVAMGRLNGGARRW
jgi:hypothetical protein